MTGNASGPATGRARRGARRRASHGARHGTRRGALATLVAAGLALLPGPALAALVTLQGTVSLIGSLASPIGATLVVRLTDVTRGVDAVRTLAEQRLSVTGRTVSYALTYDDTLIRPGGTYRAEAVLETRSGTVASTRLVLSRADFSGGRVGLLLQQAADVGAAETMQGTAWRVRRARGQEAPAFAAATLEFLRDGTLAGSTGCNRIRGRHAIGAETIRLDGLSATRRGCQNALQDFEEHYLRALRRVRVWRREGRRLTLSDEVGTPLLVLDRTR